MKQKKITTVPQNYGSPLVSRSGAAIDLSQKPVTGATNPSFVS